jgi:hypothetical protein
MLHLKTDCLLASLMQTDCPFPSLLLATPQNGLSACRSLMQTDCPFPSLLHATPQNGLFVFLIDANGLSVSFIAACYTSKRTVRLPLIDANGLSVSFSAACYISKRTVRFSH